MDYRLTVKQDRDLPVPMNKRPGMDAGYDLYALKDHWFWPLQTKRMLTNHRVETKVGEVGFVTGRSGRNKKGWFTHVGIIDTGYTGNISATVTNLSFLPRRIKRGERIAQIVFTPVNNQNYIIETTQAELERVSVGDRGANGFGSSGK